MIKIEHEQILKELCAKISDKNLKHKNTVIIGDNCTGKTALLKALSSSLDNSLFIDCPFDKKLIKNINNNINTVLVDNIETILDCKDILCINDYLNEMFNNKNIIIVTHNIELISRLDNFNIIYLHKNLYSIHDGNDFNTFNDVKILINSEKSNIDIMLTSILELKLNNLWTTIEENRLNELKEESLTNKQKIILKQILEYK